MKNLGEKIEVMTSELLNVVGMRVHNVEKLVDAIVRKISDRNRDYDFFYYVIPVKGMIRGEFLKYYSPWSDRKEMWMNVDIPRLSWIFSINNVDTFKEEMESYISENFYGQYERLMPYLQDADEVYFEDVVEQPNREKKMRGVNHINTENYATITNYITDEDKEIMKETYPQLFEVFYFKHPSVIIRTAAFLVRAAEGGVAKICDNCIFPAETTNSVTGCNAEGSIEPVAFAYPVIIAERKSNDLQARILFLAEDGRLGMCGGKRSDWPVRDIEVSSAFKSLLQLKTLKRNYDLGGDTGKYVTIMKNVGWKELKIALNAVMSKNQEEV